MQIKEDALFIADAHYNFKRENLYNLLDSIEKDKIVCSQLFLMGDIFDFIAGEATHFKKINSSIIELIQNISNKIEVYYLEGNHDYNLKKLFPNVKVYAREEQPITMKLDNKTVELSHGDIFTPKGYDIYCSIIRNSALLTFLNMLDIFGFISKIIVKKLAQKKICNNFTGFEEFAKNRLANYSADIVIEGHFHQGKNYTFLDKEYINVPSLACSNEYMRYKDKQFKRET